MSKIETACTIGDSMKKGCLLIHGLTGTPANLAPIQQALEAKGYLVKAPLLAGHGIDVATLSRSTWQQWVASAEQALAELKRGADSIYCAGLSMGGLVSLKLAADSGNNIKALALMGVPIHVDPFYRYFLIPVIRYTPFRWIVRSVPKNFEKAVLDPIGRKEYYEHSLHRMPGPAVFSMQDFVKRVKKDLPKITQPLLLIHGISDQVADPRSVEEIRRAVASNQTKMAMMGRSGHVVTMDYEREIVAERVVEFFEQISLAAKDI